MRGRTDGFAPFPRVLMQSEMQTALFRFWTWVANSISYDANHYTKHAFIKEMLCTSVKGVMNVSVKMLSEWLNQ